MQPLYQDDWTTIYHGDCRDILPALGPVALILTDPPYGANFAGQLTKWQRRAGRKAAGWDKAAPVEIVTGLLDKAPRLVIWGGNYFPLPCSRGWLAWHKPDAPPSMADVELAWTNIDQNARLIQRSISISNKERLGHPTQKPLAVMKWSLVQAGVSEGVVLDPFMGSGTALRAAKDLGLRSIGIDNVGEYCRMAARRMRQETIWSSIETSTPRQANWFDAINTGKNE